MNERSISSEFRLCSSFAKWFPARDQNKSAGGKKAKNKKIKNKKYTLCLSAGSFLTSECVFMLSQEIPASSVFLFFLLKMPRCCIIWKYKKKEKIESDTEEVWEAKDGCWCRAAEWGGENTKSKKTESIWAPVCCNLYISCCFSAHFPPVENKLCWHDVLCIQRATK